MKRKERYQLTKERSFPGMTLARYKLIKEKKEGMICEKVIDTKPPENKPKVGFEMKEETFKLDSFIGGWYIKEKVCDDLITFFESHKYRHTPGLFGANKKLDPKIKDSVEIPLSATDTIMDTYNEQLQNCLELYMKKYPEVSDLLSGFTSMGEGYNIQRYAPGGGYKQWHCERDKRCPRCLVFMTYLNTVENGGTDFKYQKLSTPATKGLTLIWPTDFTHVHRGQVAKKTKYILTGWYNFIS